MQNTLDLLSQVLFVALMAMLLYVLYRRFIGMLTKGRITGEYARVVQLTRESDRTVLLTIDTTKRTTCRVEWAGGEPVTLECDRGETTHVLETPEGVPDEVRLDFGNQVIRRMVAG